MDSFYIFRYVLRSYVEDTCGKYTQLKMTKRMKKYNIDYQKSICPGVSWDRILSIVSLMFKKYKLNKTIRQFTVAVMINGYN